MEPDAGAVLKDHFLGQSSDKHPERWNDLWKRDFTPWDRKGPSLALKDAITQHQDLFGSPLNNKDGKRKRALVPGCGRGYDVLLLASLGYDAYGLDVSASAIDAANKMKTDVGSYAVHSAEFGNGESEFLLSNFFKDGFLSQTNGGKFDLIFDYTFLCALPPELRPLWAKRMSELLGSEGKLICLEWPLGKDPKNGGPAHGLSSELYVQLLARPGEEVKYDADGKVAEEADRPKSAEALVRLEHFVPERGHEAQTGTADYLSIWRHQRQ